MDEDLDIQPGVEPQDPGIEPEIDVPEDTDPEPVGDDPDDLGGGAEDLDENLVPQSRFSEVVKERNSEREAREKTEKELEFYKNFVQNNGTRQPAGKTEQSGVPELDYSQYMNEDGELDLNRYSRDLVSAVKSGVKSEIKQELEYDNMANREWDDATKAYPEIADNPTLARIVKSVKTQSLIDGKYVTFKEIADNVFAEFGKARNAGAESVRRSEKIQSGAGLADLGTSTPKTGKGTLTNAEVARMSLPEYQKAQESGEIEKAVRAGTLKGFSIK